MVDNAHATIDVADWLGPEMDAILAGYRLDELICYRAAGFDEPTNWKIMQDAFLDGYHIQYAHPNTAGKIIHTNVMAFEDFGRHCRFIAPRKSIDRWLEEDPGDRNLDPVRHRDAFPAAQQHTAAAAGSLPAADIPAASQ